MMRSEFIERTGFDPTAEEYAEIEAQYMESDLDKDKWCAKWKRDGGIIRYANARRKHAEELEMTLASSNKNLKVMTDSRNYNQNLANEYRDEVFKLKRVIAELEHDRDTYRNKLQSIKDALTF
jgi:chromosome segregation ATPase